MAYGAAGLSFGAECRHPVKSGFRYSSAEGQTRAIYRNPVPGNFAGIRSSRSIICSMLYVWAINLIPAALIASAWFFHYTRPVTLPKSRLILFGCGLASSTLGAILLISFLMVNFADPSHVGHVNVWGGRLWIAGSLAAILSFPLSCSGRGAQRVLALSSSLTIVVLLYVGGLATSI
jgi:hypothetical protein